MLAAGAFHHPGYQAPLAAVAVGAVAAVVAADAAVAVVAVPVLPEDVLGLVVGLPLSPW